MFSHQGVLCVIFNEIRVPPLIRICAVSCVNNRFMYTVSVQYFICNCFNGNTAFVFWQIMAFYGEPQWAVVGDTFPVGCAWGNSIVYRQTSFKNNPDGSNSLYK